jgi:plastocyanin
MGPRSAREATPRFRQSLAVSLVLILALGAAALMASPGAAQEGEEDGGHPAHVHLGTCAELGEVAHALSNVGPGTVRNGEQTTGGRVVGQTEDVHPADVSSTTIDVSLEEITSGVHAINVHESTENIQNYIACGNIGGVQYGNTLVIGLAELNDSGYTGIAVLRADDDQTVVTVYLSQAEASTLDAPAETEEPADTGDGDDDGDDTAADDGDDEAAPPAEAFVSIVNFAFDPAVLEVPAGTTVIWTNNGGATHTVTSSDGIWDSGGIASGGSFSVTFTEPGTYNYFCGIHTSMTGTIIVT